MHTPKHQQGVTAIGWVIILMLIGFFALIVLKITPIYTEHYTIVSSLESLEQENIGSKSRGEIRKMLTKRFDINNIRGIHPDDIEIDKTRGVTTVRVAYEVKEKFVANVSLLLEFDTSIEVE